MSGPASLSVAVGRGRGDLRASALRARRILRRDEIFLLSDSVARRGSSSCRSSSRPTAIACYVALKDEIQTRKIMHRALRKKKRVLVPYPK